MKTRAFSMDIRLNPRLYARICLRLSGLATLEITRFDFMIKAK
jgi:hypothetical protein